MVNITIMISIYIMFNKIDFFFSFSESLYRPSAPRKWKPQSAAGSGQPMEDHDRSYRPSTTTTSPQLSEQLTPNAQGHT